MFDVTIMIVNIDEEFQDSNWYLDNKASKHVTRDANKMINIQRSQSIRFVAS